MTFRKDVDEVLARIMDENPEASFEEVQAFFLEMCRKDEEFQKKVIKVATKDLFDECIREANKSLPPHLHRQSRDN